MQVICLLLCLGLVEALAVLQRDQVAQHAIKLYRSKGATQSHSWVAGNCKKLVGLLRQKNVVVKKLAAAAAAVGKDRGLSEAEKHFQVPVHRCLSTQQCLFTYTERIRFCSINQCLLLT